MLIQSPPSADAGAAPLPGSATHPAHHLSPPSPIPSLSETAAASSPPEAADQALAKYVAHLKTGISRVTAEREALALRVEQLAALNLETAEEVARAREEQAREAARAAARAESSAAVLKQLQERIARLSGQLQEVQGAVQQGAARNATLAELARRAQDELTQHARERGALLAQAEEATARLRTMQQERDALRGELAALAAQNRTLSGRVAGMEAGNGKAASEPGPVREEMVGRTATGRVPEEVAVAFADIFPEDVPLFPEEEPLFKEVAPLFSFTAPREETGQQGLAGAALPSEIDYDLPPVAEPVPDATSPTTAAPAFPSFPGVGDHLFFGSADPEELPSFVLQPGLQAIQCGRADEVVSLHQPVNVANLSLDGKGQEICQGYICCIRRGEGTEVYAAIVGVKSGRIRIYAPEEQPRDDDATLRAVRGAVAFGEQVGLVIEEDAGEPSGERVKSVRRCPVIRLSAEP